MDCLAVVDAQAVVPPTAVILARPPAACRAADTARAGLPADTARAVTAPAAMALAGSVLVDWARAVMAPAAALAVMARADWGPAASDRAERPAIRAATRSAITCRRPATGPSASACR